MKKFMFFQTIMLFLLTAVYTSFAQDKPNILVIWGDDIGRSNISAYTMGMMGYQTPNIDRIAEEGMIFTDYYGEQSCTAGRSSFITGQSVFRTGLSKVGLPGADLGLKTELLFNLSQLVHQKAGLPVRPNKAVIGPTLFHVESGIIASWMRMTGREHRLELVPFAPELVGQKDIQLVMGKNSGLDSVRTWLEEAGMTATDEQMLDMLKLVKNKAFEKNGLLAKQEFKELAEKVLLDTA